MIYTDYEDVCDYDIICNTEQLVLLLGYNHTAKEFEYYWGANTAEDIINSIEKNHCFITFIPHQWIEEFERAGFSIKT